MLDLLLSGEYIGDFKSAHLVITVWGDKRRRDRGEREIITFWGAAYTTEVDKVLFTTLLTEYVKMIENEESGTVTVTTNEDVIVKTSGS